MSTIPPSRAVRLAGAEDEAGDEDQDGLEEDLGDVDEADEDGDERPRTRRRR